MEESLIERSGFDELHDLMKGLEAADSVILEKAFEYKMREREENTEDAN